MDFFLLLLIYHQQRYGVLLCLDFTNVSLPVCSPWNYVTWGCKWKQGYYVSVDKSVNDNILLLFSSADDTKTYTVDSAISEKCMSLAMHCYPWLHLGQ